MGKKKLGDAEKDVILPGTNDSVTSKMDTDLVIQELLTVDDQYLELQRQHMVERLELDRAYRDRCAPLFQQRFERLALPLGGQAFPVHPAGGTPAIPGFWKTVLQNSAEYQEDIEEYDEPVLDFLRDVVCDMFEGSTGFRIRFLFEPNPYFSNTELAKVYRTEPKSPYSERLECTQIESSKIEWHPGKNVTVEAMTKKSKDKGRKKTKTRREEVPRPSFFRVFFRNLGPDDEIPEEELEEQEEEDDYNALMECLLADDFEQALTLRDSIIPHAVRWYTGEACDEDDEDDDLDNEEEEEEEADDDAEKEEEGNADEVENEEDVKTTRSSKFPLGPEPP